MKSLYDKLVERLIAKHPWAITSYRRSATDGINSMLTETVEETFMGSIITVSGRYIKELFGEDAVVTSTFYVLFVDSQTRDMMHLDYIVGVDTLMSGRTMRFHVLQNSGYCQFLLKELE